jgi:hypothetical protein
MIKDSNYMGDWGKIIPVNENVHISQTNQNAYEGTGAHVTTKIQGTQVKVHDYFDANGNFLRTDFGKW